jgi:hypothetical protein
MFLQAENRKTYRRENSLLAWLGCESEGNARSHPFCSKRNDQPSVGLSASGKAPLHRAAFSDSKNFTSRSLEYTGRIKSSGQYRAARPTRSLRLLKYTARSIHFALGFLSVIAGWLREQRRSNSFLTRTVWRFHVPRIWIRSINPCGLPVKRKSQNLADFLPTRLYLVVSLHTESFFFVLFLHVVHF